MGLLSRFNKVGFLTGWTVLGWAACGKGALDVWMLDAAQTDVLSL